MLSDSFSLSSITRGLSTRFIGQRVIYLPSVTSTMDVAREEAQGGAPEGTIVVADEQTAGKGRLKRSWLSPQGSIALSLILRPSRAQLSSLIMIASVAVSRSIEQVAGLKTQIKWPNDVLIEGRKVCGILIENNVVGEKVHYSVIGIGINVNVSTATFPEIQTIATSLSEELSREVSRLNVLRSLLVEAEKLYLGLSNSTPVYHQWRDRLMTLGKEVRVKVGEETHEGVAESVGPDGSLWLRRSDGSLTKIIAGDVTLRG